MRPITHIGSHRRFKSKADRAFERFMVHWAEVVTGVAPEKTITPIDTEPKVGNVFNLEKKNVSE